MAIVILIMKPRKAVRKIQRNCSFRPLQQFAEKEVEHYSDQDNPFETLEKQVDLIFNLHFFPSNSRGCFENYCLFVQLQASKKRKLAANANLQRAQVQQWLRALHRQLMLLLMQFLIVIRVSNSWLTT